MSNDLISRKALFNEMFVRNGKVCPNHDIDNFPIRFNVKDIKQTIRNTPTAYDVDKVVEQLKQQAEQYRMRGFDIEQKGFSNIADKYYGKQCSYEHAIEIVKSGGVEND